MNRNLSRNEGLLCFSFFFFLFPIFFKQLCFLSVFPKKRKGSRLKQVGHSLTKFVHAAWHTSTPTEVIKGGRTLHSPIWKHKVKSFTSHNTEIVMAITRYSLISSASKVVTFDQLCFENKTALRLA